MSTHKLIDNELGEITSSALTLADEGSTFLLIADGLSDQEGVQVELMEESSGDWYKLVNGGGTLITANSNWAQLTGPCTVRVTKPVTLAPVTVMVVYANGRLEGV